MTKGELDRAFDATISVGVNRFFSVLVDGNDRGIIMFCPVSGANELHLCLGTWFTHTRPAVRAALRAVGGIIVAQYCELNWAVTRLLDDLGFNGGEVVTDHATGHRWKYRTLNVDINPAYRS